MYKIKKHLRPLNPRLYFQLHIMDEMAAFKKLDDVGNWENFICLLPTIVINWVIRKSDQVVQLKLVEGNFASISISITHNFSVTALHFNIPVPLRDLLGFAAKLTSGSQLEAIVCHTLSNSLSVIFFSICTAVVRPINSEAHGINVQNSTIFSYC